LSVISRTEIRVRTHQALPIIRLMVIIRLILVAKGISERLIVIII
jgi:hypothetical protein